MKTLKNFGLGKTSLEDSIHFEVTEMIEKVFRWIHDISLRISFPVFKDLS